MDNNEVNRLSMENKQLRLQLSNAIDQAENFKRLNNEGGKAYNDLAKKIKDFCGQITSSEYAKRQISQNRESSKMDLDELLTFAIEEYYKQKKEFRDFSTKLSEQIDKRDKIIEDQLRQISIYEIELAQPRYISNEPIYQEDANGDTPIQQNNQSSNFTNDDFDIPMPSIDDEFGGVPSAFPPGISKENQEKFSTKNKQNIQDQTNFFIDDEDLVPIVPKEKSEVVQSQKKEIKATYIKEKNEEKEIENPDNGFYVPPVYSKPQPQEDGVSETQRQAIKMKIAQEKQQKEQKFMISDIGPLIEEVKNNKIWYDILSLIGEKGISQRPKIEEMLSSAKDSAGKTMLSTQIMTMQKAGLISRENINTGYRRFIVLDLAPIGIKVFEEIFKKSPVESELRRLTRENASKEHGYLIEDAKVILLKEFGYKHVSIDRNKNTIVLPNGKKYIPDIVASIDGKVWDYIEVERGTHTKEDFNGKLEKMFLTTRTFHFVAQNKETLDIIIEKVEKWVYSKDKTSLKNLKIKYSTLSHLAKRNWLVIKTY